MDVITTAYGKIAKRYRDGYQEYLGIPYAKPPVGDLRWKRPEKPDAWEGVLRAEKFPNRCVQFPSEGFYKKEFYEDPAFMPPMSEDCLYLNIWTPEDAGPESTYPVAFWIHGGAFMGGFNSEEEFDGEAFARKGVILVTVSYRLGIFGFFAAEELDEENKEHISGNYGIFDQIAALSFVRENIAAFGGDPDNITIFGQSAGAMSVQTICSSPLTKGMFARAILQSGGSYGRGLHKDVPLLLQEKICTEIMDYAGKKTAADMRKISADQLVGIFGAYMGMKMKEAGEGAAPDLCMVPVIDGYLLKSGYYETMDEGNLHNIPYLIGSNADDILPDLLDSVKAFSLREEEVQNNPAYVYYFTRKMPGDDAGAFHSAELWYVFGTLKRCWRPVTEKDFALSEKMVTLWTTFMKKGDPGEGWRKYKKDDPYVEVLDI